MIRRLSAIALLLALCGCATTPSGQALQSWLGRPFSRLAKSTDPRKLFDQETRRAQALLARLPAQPRQEARRAIPLLRETAQRGQDVFARTRDLPGNVSTTVNHEVRQATSGIQSFVKPDGALRQAIDPGRNVAAVRRIPRQLSRLLRLDRPILSGRGDPYTQTGAFRTGSRETWVERILRRVRL